MRRNRSKSEIQAELEQAYKRIAELEAAATTASIGAEGQRAEIAQRDTEKRLRAMLEISQALSIPRSGMYAFIAFTSLLSALAALLGCFGAPASHPHATEEHPK